MFQAAHLLDHLSGQEPSLQDLHPPPHAVLHQAQFQSLGLLLGPSGRGRKVPAVGTGGTACRSAARRHEGAAQEVAAAAAAARAPARLRRSTRCKRTHAIPVTLRDAHSDAASPMRGPRFWGAPSRAAMTARAVCAMQGSVEEACNEACDGRRASSCSVRWRHAGGRRFE